MDKIENLLSQVIAMLSENNASLWERRMSKLLIHLQKTDDKKEAASLIMRSMLGGMGSLSDLALYRDGKPLIEENDKFQALLDQLFDECKRFLTKEPK